MGQSARHVLVNFRFERRAWPEPPVFDFVRRTGDVPEPEMLRTFNLGLGLVLVVAPGDAEAAVAAATGAGYEAWRVGEVIAAGGGERVVFTD